MPRLRAGPSGVKSEEVVAGSATARLRARLRAGLGSVLPLRPAAPGCQNNRKGSFRTPGQTAGGRSHLAQPQCAPLPRGGDRASQFCFPSSSPARSFPLPPLLPPTPGCLSRLHFPDLSRTRSSSGSRCPSADGSGRSRGREQPRALRGSWRASPATERAGADPSNCRLEAAEPQWRETWVAEAAARAASSSSRVPRRAALVLMRSDFGLSLLCFS